MAKNFTEEELKQDPLINSYARIQKFYINNKNVIIGSAVAVLLAIALAIGYHYYQKSQNKKAQQLMGVAENHFLQGNYKQALNGSDQDLTVGFEQILNNYSNTETGNLAHYYAAICEYNLGNTKQALSYINEYDVPDGILGVAPLSFKGVLLTDLGNNKKAAQAFVKAAEWDKNESTTSYNYLEAANAYYAAGDTTNAKKYAQLIVDDYANSSQAPEAQKLLGRLTATDGG